MDEKLRQALDFAKANKLPWIEVDGIKIPVPGEQQAVEIKIQSDDDLKKIFAIEDPLAGLTDDQILFWHSDYYDVLEQRELIKKEALEKEQQVRE